MWFVSLQFFGVWAIRSDAARRRRVIEERGEAWASGPVRSVRVATKELRMSRRAVNPGGHGRAAGHV